MARTLLATLPAAALALRATRPTVSMHTNIFPTFTIKDKAAALGQRLLPRRRDFLSGVGVYVRMVLLRLRAARGGGGAREGTVRTLGAARPRPCAASRDESERAREKHEDER